MGKDLKGKELGEGLCQIKDGRYMARYTDIFGKRKTIYGHKLKEVKEKFTKAKYENAVGLGINSNAVTMNELYGMWINERRMTCKPSTVYNSEKIYYKHVAPTMGLLKISNIELFHINQFLNEKRKSVSVHTINNIKTVLSGMFKMAQKQKYMIVNPITLLETCKNYEVDVNKKRKILTDDEINTFLTYGTSKKHCFIDLYKFLLMTGVRIGEALALRWSDVDFEKRVISINKTFMQTVKVKKYNQTPKSKSSVRLMPISDELLELLNFHKTTKFSGDDFVFVGKRKQPLSKNSVDRSLDNLIIGFNKKEEDLAQKENREPQFLPHIHPHMFRHTFATKCFEKNIPPKIVQNYLGHASVKTALDVYTHIQNDTLFNYINELHIV